MHSTQLQAEEILQQIQEKVFLTVNDSFRTLLASKTGAFDGTSQIGTNQAARSSHHHHAQHPFHPSKHKDHGSSSDCDTPVPNIFC